MSLISILVLSLGLATDAFAVTASNSMCYPNLKREYMILSSIMFGVFQGAMPIIGYFLGQTFGSYIEPFDHWIAMGLLCLIGINMIRESINEMRNPEGCEIGKEFNMKLMVTQAFATSIDALIVGVALSIENVNIFIAAGIIAAITFVCCFIAGVVGKKLGSVIGNKAGLIGGLVLIGIGVKVLLEHLLVK